MTSNFFNNPAIKAYGWEAVPRDIPTLLSKLSEAKGNAPTFSVSSIPIPDTKLAKAVHEYAEKELGKQTFNHSLRVWYYGIFHLPLTYHTPPSSDP
jgi:cyanamide hydratase